MLHLFALLEEDRDGFGNIGVYLLYVGFVSFLNLLLLFVVVSESADRRRKKKAYFGMNTFSPSLIESIGSYDDRKKMKNYDEFQNDMNESFSIGSN